jgi:hypothetical protein
VDLCRNATPRHGFAEQKEQPRHLLLGSELPLAVTLSDTKRQLAAISAENLNKNATGAAGITIAE